MSWNKEQAAQDWPPGYLVSDLKKDPTGQLSWSKESRENIDNLIERGGTRKRDSLMSASHMIVPPKVEPEIPWDTRENRLSNKPKTGLTELQEMFCEEYVVDFMLAAAVARAHKDCDLPLPVSPSPGAIARKWMKKAEVKDRICALRDQVSHDTGVDTCWVVEKLVENVGRAMQSNPVLDKDGNETGEYRYEGGVANQALAQLGKHTGGFVDKVDVRAIVADCPADAIYKMVENEAKRSCELTHRPEADMLQSERAKRPYVRNERSARVCSHTGSTQDGDEDTEDMSEDIQE